MQYATLLIILLGSIIFSSFLISSDAKKADFDARAIHEEGMEASTPRLCSCDDNNTCTEDSCVNDICKNEVIECLDSMITCPDGFVAFCSNTCNNGCSNCTPSCEGHFQSLPCISIWKCSDWGECDKQQTRDCTDTACNAPPRKEVRQCTSLGHVIFSEIFYDAPGKENVEEWVKLYNPTAEQIEIVNWSIIDNAGEWKFSAVIGSKSHLLIARNSEGFRNLTGCDADIDGMTRGLNNDGDYIMLKDGSKEIDFVAWESGYNKSHPDWTIESKDGSIKRISLLEDTDLPADWVAGVPEPCSDA